MVAKWDVTEWAILFQCSLVLLSRVILCFVFSPNSFDVQKTRVLLDVAIALGMDTPRSQSKLHEMRLTTMDMHLAK